MSKESDIKTVPFDPRFPQQNQTLNCFIHYMDYYRCLDALDGDSQCEYFKKVFTTICPNAWIAKWDEQREAGSFPGKIIRVPKDFCEAQEKKKKDDECCD